MIMGSVEELQCPWQGDTCFIAHHNHNHCNNDDHDDPSPILTRHPSSHAHYTRHGSISRHRYSNAAGSVKDSPSTVTSSPILTRHPSSHAHYTRHGSISRHRYSNAAGSVKDSPSTVTSSPILTRHPSSHAHYTRHGSISRHRHSNAADSVKDSPSTVTMPPPRLTTSNSINNNRSKSRNLVASTYYLEKNETPDVVHNGFPDQRKRRRGSYRRKRRGTEEEEEEEEKDGIAKAISSIQLNPSAAARPAMARFLARFKNSFKAKPSHSSSSSNSRKAQYRRGSLACTTPHHIPPLYVEYRSRSKSIWPFTASSSSSIDADITNQYTFPHSPPQLSYTQCKDFSLARPRVISSSTMFHSLELDSSSDDNMTSPNSKPLDKHSASTSLCPSIVQRKKAPLIEILHRLSSCTSSTAPSHKDIINIQPVISPQDHKPSQTLKGLSMHSIRLPPFLSSKLKRNDTVCQKNGDSSLRSIEEGNGNKLPTVLPTMGRSSKMGSMVDQIDISEAISWLNEQYPIKEEGKVETDDMEDILCNGKTIVPCNGYGNPSNWRSSNEEEYYYGSDSSSDLFDLQILSTNGNGLP